MCLMKIILNIGFKNINKNGDNMDSNEIIMASGNKGKIREAQEILKEYKIIPMKEIGIEIDVEEDQETFEGNAIKKSEIIAKELNGKTCLADDSGIEIEFLDGFPRSIYKKMACRNR